MSQPAHATDHLDSAPSARTVLKRKADRGSYEAEVIHSILDASFVCHVGFHYEGATRVIPTAYVRDGNHVYLHGSTASRMLRSLCRGDACITVTLLDGLSVARSAFHMSVNYRSVVIFGQGEVVQDEREKHDALRLLIDHMIPGRWNDVRPPESNELAQALVVRVPLDEASAKIRRGDPIEEERDYALPCWAGTIPLRQVPRVPVDDARLQPGTPVPDYARDYREPGSR